MSMKQRTLNPPQLEPLQRTQVAPSPPVGIVPGLFPSPTKLARTSLSATSPIGTVYSPEPLNHSGRNDDKDDYMAEAEYDYTSGQKERRLVPSFSASSLNPVRSRMGMVDFEEKYRDSELKTQSVEATSLHLHIQKLQQRVSFEKKKRQNLQDQVKLVGCLCD